MRDETTRVERALRVLTALLIVLASTGFAVGAVAGADQVAVITPSPHSVDAEPGEEFTVDITLVTNGGYGDEGVESADLVAQYHPDYLEITAIEPGPWLEQDEETDVHDEERLAHDEGTAILEQWRDPVAGGATGNERLATITVEVADDAPPGQASIDFEETSVYLERAHPQLTHDQNVSVTIDGDDEAVDSFDHPDPDELQTERGGENGDESEATDESADADDSIPGFDGSTLIVTALVGLVVAFWTVRDRS